NPITFTAVPIGTQQRIGIDRDMNGVLDGDEPGAATSTGVCGGAAHLAQIDNAGVEAQTLGAGGYTRSAPLGWTSTAAVSGPWSPTGSFHAPEGSNIAYLDTTGTISQTLAERFDAGAHYRLRVMVGGDVPLGWQVRLLAGSTVLGTMSAAQLMPP